MNRRKLQKIILEELSNARHVRTQHRVLRLVDYLYESSDQNLLKIREGDGAFGYLDNANPGALSRRSGTATASAADKAATDKAATDKDATDKAAEEQAAVANPPVEPAAPAPAAAAKLATRPEALPPRDDTADAPSAPAVAPVKSPSGTTTVDLRLDPTGDSDGDPRPESEADNLESGSSTEGGSEEDSAGEVPPPTLSLSDTIDNKIESAAKEALTAPAPAAVAEGVYWRRGLVDLLYSS